MDIAKRDVQKEIRKKQGEWSMTSLGKNCGLSLGILALRKERRGRACENLSGENGAGPQNPEFSVHLESSTGKDAT